MHFDNPFGDGQAQASSALFTRPSFVGSPEPIEDVRQIGFRNPYSRIRDRNQREIFTLLKIYSYKAACSKALRRALLSA